MSLFIDAIIIIAAVASIYFGIVRGFVRSVMGFAALMCAIIAAALLSPMVSELMYNGFIAEKVSEIASDAIGELISAGEQRLELSGILADRPEALGSLVERFGGDIDELSAHYGELDEFTDDEAIKSLADRLTASTARGISNVLAALGVFVAALILLKLLLSLIDLVCRLPVLSTLNTLLGLIFGVFTAIAAALVIANTAASLISAMNAIDPAVFNQSVIDDSIILRFMSEQGLILSSR